MNFKHALLATIALGLAVAPGAQASSSKIVYSTSGSYATNDCSHEIDCTPLYGYTGGSTCTKNCLPGAPTTGTFAIDLSGSPLHPPGPCLSKKVQGTVEVLWADRTTTTASITGTYSKKKAGYNLKVTVTGGTNPFTPPGPPNKGFVNHPPSPCSPGSFAGSLAFGH
jgi:hypothetical protein